MLRVGQLKRRQGTSLVPLLVMGLMALSCEYGRVREREDKYGDNEGEGRRGREILRTRMGRGGGA